MERAIGSERIGIGALIPVEEHMARKTLWKIYHFNDPDNKIANLSKAGVPMEKLVDMFEDELTGVQEIEGNLLLNEGINELWTLATGTGGTKWDSGNAYIGVGDSATAENASQTGLQAATNKLYKAMDATYPTYGTSQKATWRSTFGSSDANWAWNEITVSNTSGGDTGKNLNRKVSSMGTKSSGTTWIATLEITLA